MTTSPLQNTYLFFLLLVFLGIGFFGSIYYVEHENRFTKHHYSTTEILRSRAMFHRLHRVEYRNAHLESQVAELSLRTSELYEDASYDKVQKLSRHLGLIQQEGPGIEITVKDSSKPLLLGDNPNTGIVHNTDLVQVVNDLRAGGAKAVSINKQPITNLTAVSCSGPIILVNGTRIASPFTIDALGDTHQMMSFIDQQNSFIKELQKYGIEVSITRKPVTIPAYSQDMAGL